MMKKTFVKTLIYLSILLSALLAILKCYHHGSDISLYPVKNIGRSYSEQKKWLISFGNKDVYIQNQTNLIASAAMYQAFDIIISYQSHNIDPEYYEKHKEILSSKRGAGYWLWKPYFILKTLKMMPEDDILLYVDSSGVFRDGIYELLNLAKEHNIVLFPNPILNNRGWIKKTVIDKMVDGDDSYLDKKSLHAGIILLRNTEETRKFIEEWLKFCEDPELITDIPSDDEYSDFKDHRHDQSILSILYDKNPGEHYLYDPYPAMMKSFILTRRRDQCSLLRTTFGDHTKFSWFDLRFRFMGWFLGCQHIKMD